MAWPRVQAAQLVRGQSFRPARALPWQQSLVRQPPMAWRWQPARAAGEEDVEAPLEGGLGALKFEPLLSDAAAAKTNALTQDGPRGSEDADSDAGAESDSEEASEADGRLHADSVIKAEDDDASSSNAAPRPPELEQDYLDPQASEDGSVEASDQPDKGWVKLETALVSVFDKTGLEEIANYLSSHGVHVLSTGGTAAKLRDLGCAVEDVAEYTGFPEILDGRVKTLHPKVHGGLLAKRDNEAHERDIAEGGIRRIDLVITNLYPFDETVATGSDFNTCVENIDIGGPTMIRAAAKNCRSVAVVTKAEQYNSLIAHLSQNSQGTTYEFRQELAAAGFALTGAYDAAVSAYCSQQVSAPLDAKQGSPARVGDDEHGDDESSAEDQDERRPLPLEDRGRDVDGAETGRIARWNHDRGFGFLLPDRGGENIFVHVSSLADGDGSVQNGDKVSFFRELSDRTGKDHARDVRLISTFGRGRDTDFDDRGGGYDRDPYYSDGDRGDGGRSRDLNRDTDFYGDRGGDSDYYDRGRSPGRDFDDDIGRGRDFDDRGRGGRGAAPRVETGTMRNWNFEKGFGFIRPADDGPDLFCHVSTLVDGDGSLKDGDPVTFISEWDGRRGKMEARDVQYDYDAPARDGDYYGGAEGGGGRRGRGDREGGSRRPGERPFAERGRRGASGRGEGRRGADGDRMWYPS